MGTVTSPASRAAAGLGAEPAGVWVAPGRVNLIGEHTDYNDGFVLPFALPQVTAVAAAPADEWTVTSEHFADPVTFTGADLRPGGVPDWAAYVAGVAWALRQHGVDPPKARISIATDVPLGAGLSSSAAIECAVMAALCDLGDIALDDWDRVKLVQRAENGYVGLPNGIMDQSASTLCRAGHALFLDCRSLDVAHIPFDVAAVGLAVLVVNTNAPHQLVSGEYAKRREVCESAAAALGLRSLRELTPARLPAALERLDAVQVRRTRHVVTENQRVLDTVDRLRSGDIAGIGPLLTASHRSLRDDYEVTVPELDTAVAAALDAGALGARMTGGGFGGCVLALVPAAEAGQVAAAVADAFAASGFAAPESFVAEPSQGAHRVK
jgi:galactokinase